jgi:YihY family inner membrane protein
MAGWLDRFQQKHTWAGFPIAVIYKYADDQGNYLAALITYYGFLSLFPLLLLLSTVLGFALSGNPELQQQILDSTLSQFPVIGEQLGDPHGLKSGGIGLVVGILGTIYGGMGVAQAMQNAMNIVWSVPRIKRPNPILLRLRSLLLLGTVGLAVLGTTVLSALGSSASAFGADLGAGVKVLLTALAVVLNAGIFVLAFKVATARGLAVRDIVPGALIAALVWQLLQSFGAAYIGHVVKNASATNGVFALVLGLIAWLFIEAVAVVLGVEVNVVRAQHLHPRALMTPFTDNVDLTHADERAYAQLAESQQSKGFQSVDVSFDKTEPATSTDSARDP